MYWVTVVIENDAEFIEETAKFTLPEDVNEYLTMLGNRFENGDLLFPSDREEALLELEDINFE